MPQEIRSSTGILDGILQRKDEALSCHASEDCFSSYEKRLKIIRNMSSENDNNSSIWMQQNGIFWNDAFLKHYDGPLGSIAPSRTRQRRSDDAYQKIMDGILQKIENIECKVDGVDQKLSDHHRAITSDVHEVKMAVLDGNELLKAMRTHPAETVSLFSGGLSFCAALSLVISLTWGWAPMSPVFSIYCLFSGAVYWTMAYFHKKDVRRRGRR